MRVPGDKSITHRALMLAALAEGTSRLRGTLAAGDTRSSASCLRTLGVKISPLKDGRDVLVQGKGLHGLRKPTRRLYCGNSGTTARLLMGMLAASRFSAVITGDASLRRRPMERVAAPLRTMGATIDLTDHRLPAHERGGPLSPIRYASPVASAQVKTALLLAALRGQVHVMLSEPVRSRDHTERMLAALGAPGLATGATYEFHPPAGLPAFEAEIPGDFSSAAYLLAAGVLTGAPRPVEAVGVNPTRTGFLRGLERMGARVEIADQRDSLGEPIGTLTVRLSGRSRLVPVEVAASEVPSMVDEIPLLACLAARAAGTSVFRGVGELRVKESDRLALVAANLRAVGAQARTEGDTLWVTGNEIPLRGTVETAGDHRLAMAFSVLGLGPGSDIAVDDPQCVAVSYPGFFRDLKHFQGRR